MSEDASEYIRTIPAKLWGRAVGMLGLLRDTIRIGQTEVGVPFVWVGTAEVDAATVRQCTFPVPADGLVRDFRWVLQVAPGEVAAVGAYVERVGLGAQDLFQNIGGQYAIVGAISPVLPKDEDGFLRRVAAYQNAAFIVNVNNPTDSKFVIAFWVEQYGIPPYVARRLREGYLG